MLRRGIIEGWDGVWGVGVYGRGKRAGLYILTDGWWMALGRRVLMRKRPFWDG